MPLIRFPTVKGLVYTIDLTKIADRENPRTVEAPINASGSYPEPVIIDWGDGTVETKTSGAWPTHTYAAEGVYTVTLRTATGHFPLFSFNGGTESTPIHAITKAVISVDHFGGVTGGTTVSMNNSFRNASNLKYAAPFLVCNSNVAYLSNVFQGAGLEQTLDSFTFIFCSMVTGMSAIFSGCSKATGSIPELPESVTVMSSAFIGCSSLDGYICSKLPPILTAGNYLFHGCEKLKGRFPELPSTLAGSIRNIFYHCYQLEGPLPDIPEGVTSVQEAFVGTRGATAFPALPATLTSVQTAFGNATGLNVSTNAAPELWDTANYPNITEHANCFLGLTNLSNYADIPADWK